jgi:hypothetical protein
MSEGDGYPRESNKGFFLFRVNVVTTFQHFSRSSTPLSLSLPPTYSYSYLKSMNVYAIRRFSSFFEESGLACSRGG